MTRSFFGLAAIALLALLLGACSTSQTLSSASPAAQKSTSGGSRAQATAGTGGRTSIGGTGDARPFRRDGKYGIRNAAGEVTIEPRYDIATLADTGRGLIVTQTAGKIGFVDGQGREITRPKYDSISTPKGDVYLVKAGGKSCAVDATGREFLPCIYDNILTSSDPSRFFVMQNGKGRYVNRSGVEIRYQMASAPSASAPAQTPRVAAGSSTQLPSFNLARTYANRENWPDAVAAALNGSAQDKRYVLRALHDAGNRPSTPTSYPRYSAGVEAVKNNIGIFDGAMVGASYQEQNWLASMRQQFASQMGYGRAPASGSPVWSGPSTSSSPSVRTQAPRRCYQTSNTHQTCFD